VWIGLISYPLYLWHWPLLSFARIIESATPSPAIRITIVAISVALAWLTYQLIERPIRFGTKNRVKVLALCELMLAIGVIGYAAYWRDPRSPGYAQAVFGYDHSGEYRERTCFLDADQNESAFGSCVEEPSVPSSASILLWGDSYAAHLYPGLKSELGHDSKLTQLTVSACAPMIGIDEPMNVHCKSVNSYILERVMRERPGRIVLAANWRRYANWSAVAETIRQLRNAGLGRIDLVGPLPQWTNALPDLVYRVYRNDTTLHRVPQRMSYGLVPGMDALDRELQAFFAQFDINYISAYRILCNEDGCLTRVGESVNSALTQWDTGHLTSEGAAYLVSHFPK
jgi:SGNH domain (fused to AT3 domains)